MEVICPPGPSPNIVSISPGSTSATIRAFFDPSKSERVIQNAGQIAYLQVGSFVVNSVAFPIIVHDSAPPYPILEEKQLEWLDISNLGSLEQPVIEPFFPYWIRANDQNYNDQKLFKYPQRYGGMFKNDGNPKTANDYLCATMKHTIDIGLGLLPNAGDPAEYFDGLSAEDQLVSGGLLPEEFTPQNIQNKMYEIYKAFIDRHLTSPGTSKKSEFWAKLDGDLKFFQTKTRLYIRYQSRYRAENEYESETVNVLVYPAPNNRLQYAFLDEDEIDDYIENLKVSGPVDIFKIRDRLINWGPWIFVGGPWKLQLGYRYYTFPCQFAVDVVKKTLQLRLLEGFQYSVWREYNEEAKTWSAVKYKIDNSLFVEGYVFSAVEKFMNNRGYNLQRI